MMGSIYRLAGNVIVWLGPEADGSEKAIRSLEELGRLYRTEYIEVFDKSDPIAFFCFRYHLNYFKHASCNSPCKQVYS